jgi:hypothetical protein
MVRLGVVSLRSEVMQDGPLPAAANYVRNEAAFAEFAKRDVEDVSRFAQPLVADERYFSCSLSNPVAVARFTLVDDFDAGEALRVQGPEQSLSVPHPSVPVLYLQILDPKPLSETAFFSGGEWRVSAPGGRTVGPFAVSRTLPPPLRWTNRDAMAVVDRANDQMVTWAADGYAPDDVMTVTLQSASSPQARAAAVMCRAPASTGQLIIPAGLMMEVPPLPVGRVELRLAPRPERRVRFALPLTGGGSERAVFEYQFTDTLRVVIR